MAQPPDRCQTFLRESAMHDETLQPRCRISLKLSTRNRLTCLFAPLSCRCVGLTDRSFSSAGRRELGRQGWAEALRGRDGRSGCSRSQADLPRRVRSGQEEIRGRWSSFPHLSADEQLRSPTTTKVLPLSEAVELTKRLRLPYLRKAMAEVVPTVKAQHWDPAGPRGGMPCAAAARRARRGRRGDTG